MAVNQASADHITGFDEVQFSKSKSHLPSRILILFLGCITGKMNDQVNIASWRQFAFLVLAARYIAQCELIEICKSGYFFSA